MIFVNWWRNLGNTKLNHLSHLLTLQMPMALSPKMLNHKQIDSCV